MKKLFSKKALSVVLATMLIATPILTACDGCASGETAFTMATLELDGVFNPFYATSGTDTAVWGLTQMGMLNNSGDDVAYGEDEDCVTLDLKIATTDERDTNQTEEEYEKDFANYYTDYSFIIKKGIKYHDGSELSIKDVLFNLYVYLDPAYIGASTIYSTAIKGLMQYRTQLTSEAEQKALEAGFRTEANIRKSAIITFTNTEVPYVEPTGQLAEDIATVKVLFREELNSDWTNAVSSLESISEQYPEITQPWEAFMYYVGKIIEDPEDDTKLIWNLPSKTFGNGKSRDELIDYVYNSMLDEEDTISYRDSLNAIVTGWATSQTMIDYFAADEMKKHFENIDIEYKKIDGISTSTTAVDFSGNALGSTHDVLNIRIDGVDPRAIWNFSFAVAPLKYYSSAEEAAKFNGVDHFGIIPRDLNFLETYVRGRTVPIGAGAYVASNSNSDRDVAINNRYNEFYNNNVLYFVRHNEFLMGQPKIEHLRLKVIPTNNMFTAIKNGEVHYAEPTATLDMRSNIAQNSSTLESIPIMTLGYGYIGINAGHIPNINIRKAVMSAMDVELCKGFYGEELVEILYRPMSKVSWAYPVGQDDNKYPFVENTDSELADERYPEVARYVGMANGTLGGDGILRVGGVKQEYEFVIAGGANDDHPMTASFDKAAVVLGRFGIKVRVVKDTRALSKLTVGELAVWAAAWATTIDPDMYQVYHMDSNATSVNAWGYPQILGNQGYYSVENQILVELAQLIEDGRKTIVREERIPIYNEAMEKVLDLAVELPTYQRYDLVVYNKKVINSDTLNPNPNAYNGPFSRLWEVEFV